MLGNTISTSKVRDLELMAYRLTFSSKEFRDSAIDSCWGFRLRAMPATSGELIFSSNIAKVMPEPSWREVSTATPNSCKSTQQKDQSHDES